MLRAEIRGRGGEVEKALEDCEWALRHSPNIELEWYLTRGELQSRLGRFREAARGLSEGWARTGSAVLEVEYIEALIDGGQFGQALEKIEPLLAEARWRSSWLIRRARVELGQGQIAAAQGDLLAAVQEITARLQGAQLESGLLADRALAYALLGDVGLARQDYIRAKKMGADAATLLRLESLLRADAPRARARRALGG
jgi:tetratricopeptide (TPR) repeat protein